MVAAVRFRKRRLRAEAKPRLSELPPISVLKPLHGAEPGLEENLRGFFRQSYAGGYELLFCARHEDDAGLQVARKFAEEHPERQVRILTCGEPKFPNPKMYSLSVMSQAARHDLLVTSDADARVQPDYLARCVAELDEPSAELASCLYVGTAEGGDLFLELDALGKSVEMSSGALVADMLSGTDFALGVTMVLRKRAFNEAGGCEDLGRYWAEDFVLGNRLAARGFGVCLSTHVVELIVTADNNWHSFRNQLRWVQSTRRSRPLGHLGSGLTYSTPFALLGFAVEANLGHWSIAAIFLGASMLNRMLQSFFILNALGAQNILRGTLLYPIRDGIGSLLWFCSYLPADTRYHNTRFRIMPDGRLAEES